MTNDKFIAIAVKKYTIIIHWHTFDYKLKYFVKILIGENVIDKIMCLYRPLFSIVSILN